MQWHFVLNRFGDFDGEVQLLQKVETWNITAIGPRDLLGGGQPTYRKNVFSINATSNSTPSFRTHGPGATLYHTFLQ